VPPLGVGPLVHPPHQPGHLPLVHLRRLHPFVPFDRTTQRPTEIDTAAPVDFCGALRRRGESLGTT
jgi:hypothetical protein